MQIVTNWPLRARLNESPAAVYLVSLGSPTSRRTMQGALDRIAAMVAPGSDAPSFPWHRLRVQHTLAIRSRLANQFAPTTANKYLTAQRGV